MSRSRKLLTAIAILTLGIVLSWPFRQTQESSDSSAHNVDDFPRAINGDPITMDSSGSEPHELDVPVAPAHVSARMASTNDSPEPPSNQALESFDLANHPAMQSHPIVSHEDDSSPDIGATSGVARPAYSVAEIESGSNTPDDWPQEVLHVVCNGDTLERLAERYLDDPGRGLEIFDLNRDQLSNPYLLPIGVELRIPAQESRPVD
ncbi:LysM peptidoglycan-binding domain-containing protein [Bythopirellula goksoeyrii]|nr:LysM peptidoglycan-binding domain-containing protein [Bythopirellula goksoeyrii]